MTTIQQSQSTKKSIPGDELSLLTNFELHQKFTQLGRERHRLTYELLYLLPEIAHRSIYREKGFLTIYEYAAKTAGLGHSAVEKALRLGRVLKDKPALKEIVKTEGVHKVALVATIATCENERQLAEKVVGMSKSALADLAKELRNYRSQSESASWLDGECESRKPMAKTNELKKCQAAEQKITITLEGDLLFEFLKMKQQMEKSEKVVLSNVQVIKRLMDCKEEELRTNNTFRKRKKSGTGQEQKQINLQKTISSPGTKTVTRYIPAAQKRAIIAQTRGRCAYPRCQRPYDQIHHRERFSNQPAAAKSHQSSIPLCSNHHKFAHNQLISNELKPRKEWILTLNGAPDSSDTKVLQFW